MNLPASLSESGPAPRRASSSFLELASHSAVLIALLDREGRVIESNRTFNPLFAAAFTPESRGPIERAIAHTAREEQALQVEAAMPHDDGTLSWYLIVFSPVMRDDKVRAILTHAFDITARRREEERLRRSEALMVDTQGVAHLGVWDWDVTLPNASWSPELYRIYGLDPKVHAPSYQDYLTRVHPDDRQRVMDATNAAFHDHKPYSHDERIYRSDGVLRYLHTWAYPVLDGAGKLLRLTGVCQDITDRKLAENAVIEHAAQLARANAELEQFARLAAHDLQEPLRTITSFVQILAMNFEGRLDANSKQAMDFIEQATRRMKAQITDLLRYVQETSRDAPREAVSVGDAVERVRAELRAAIVESGAVIRHGDLPSVIADPLELDCLLRNLIDNAIKYRGTQPPAIDIEATASGEQVEIVVRDNGIGIAPEHQDRVFVVFQRLNPDLPGGGIGLAVCKKIIDRNGGRIWLESVRGQGTAIHFTLPSAHVA